MSSSSLLQKLSLKYSPDDVVLRDHEKEWTLLELQARVLLWRTRLALPSGYSVALYGDNSLDWIAIDIACMEAGLICVPLPGFFSDSQLSHILNTVKPAMLLSDNPARTGMLVEPTENWFRDTSFTLTHLPDSRAADCPRGTGKITFTSGSTGEPKGVCLSNELLIRQAERLHQRVGLDAPDHLCVLPLSTLLENVAGVYAPLLAGGKVRVLSLGYIGIEGSSQVNPSAFSAAITTYEPTTLILIPELLQLLVMMSNNQWQAPASLRFVAVGGSKVAAGQIEKARRAGIPAYEGYGLSECASVVSLNVPWVDKPHTSGRLLDGISASVENGEIVVSGSAMLGYFNDKQSWYQDSVHTGDLGDIDNEGYVTITGRAKNLMISSFGRNISPEWVESELCQNTLIRDSVVFGDNRPWCCALISVHLDEMKDSDIDSWIKLVNHRLPDYARIRTWFRLHEPLSAIPGLTTTTGKPRREAIARYFAGEIEDLYQTSPNADEELKSA